MKNKLTLLLLAFMFGTAALKAQQMGALTVFSEDGDRFYLIINGLRQNQEAKTNVRVDGLTDKGVSAKVIFENKALPEISKNLMIEDVNNQMMDVTYKIKHDAKGNPKISSLPFSYKPYQQNYVPTNDVYVVHYGSPAPVATTTTTVVEPATTVQHTTTTTTTTNGVPGAAVNVNVGGLNMNMSVVDPTMNTTVQTTTTRTTTTSTNTVNDMPPPPPPAPVHEGCRGAYAMMPGDFASAINAVKKESFDDTKVSTAEQIADGNCLSASQVAEMCKQFSFEENKLKFAKYAFTHCTEPQNYYKINSVFSFSSSTEDLNNYVREHR